MYENVTFEDILERMLERVPDSMDKREGSIIYDALAPAAVELQLMYIELDVILNESFGDTASREYLIRRAAERGLAPSTATHAILKAESTPASIEIAIGSRFSLNELNYVVLEKITDGEYQVQCESVGVVGNKYFGQLIPIDYIQGLETINLTEILIPGEDDEDTEVFRQRYFESFDTKAYGGNIGDYIQKTNELPGVGSTKVTPVWNGGGTVLLTILNSEFDKASDILIQSVQTAIDPSQDATGIGIAPIGHVVTVQTAEEVEINISTSIVFQEGFTFNSKKAEIEAAIKDYLLTIRKEWDKQTSSTVRIAQIDSKIMGIKGVLDVTGTTINGVAANFLLSNYQIPVLGVIANA